MSRNSLSNEIRDDEIDLLELFRRIGRTFSKWFRAAGRALLIVIVFLIRNIIPLIFSVFIGTGLSYLMKWRSKPVYHSQIVLRNNAVQNSDMIDYFDKLSFLIKEGNISAVSSALSISPEKAAGIKEIKANWVIDINKDGIPDYIDYKRSFNLYDTVNTRMQDRIVIDIEVTEPKNLPDISKGFIMYARQNPAFRQMNEFRLRKDDELLARLNYDIKQLDSLQKVKYFEETRNKQPEKGGQIIFLQEQKTQLVYDDIYKLYERKQYLDREKELYPDILTVLSDFYQPMKRYNGGLYYGKVIIPLVFGLTVLYLVLARNRKKLRDIFKKY
jgi:hypothetical protein